MSINEIIILIMVIFMAIGVIDKCIGNKFGYGEKFEEGINAMGSLALAMIGAVAIAPILAYILEPIVAPVYRLLNADPAMFAGTLLANDMGGYPLAMQLASSREVGLYSGLILGAMLGPTIVFTIPVALGIIEERDRSILAKGVLAGMITIPIGTLVGGIVAGFDISMVLANLTPIIIFAGLIALGLWKIPTQMIKGFTVFGQGVVVLITAGLGIAIAEHLLGITIISLDGGNVTLAPVTDGIEIVGEIAIVLAGAFPLVHFITKVFNKPLLKLGHILGMNDKAAAGMVATLANSIPMFGILKDMDERGKVINVAFAVSAAFVFGDHLGFTAGVEPEMITAVIIGKLVAGVTAVFVAIIILNKSSKK